MITLKFGGTSMGNARRIWNSAQIMAGRAEKDRVSVVVSAAAGVSNMLQDSIAGCAAGENPGTYTAAVRKLHTEICAGLAGLAEGFPADEVLAVRLEPHFEEYGRLLSAVAAFGECPPSVHCRIMGLGELLCAPIVEAALRTLGQDVKLLDSRKYIYASGSQTEGDPDYIKTAEAFAPLLSAEKGQPQILLFPGFICTWKNSRMGLLGRNGSDFSAAIIACSLSASRVEFWTDVDGIYTADPRIVSDAILVDDMTYEEAMELSFFGSKVLHPKTLAPLAAKGIEAWSLNSHNPSARGTRIGAGPFGSSLYEGPVRGISCLKKTSMISVSGSGMKGRSGIAARIFNAVSRAGASMLLITQSSSEYTITFCIRQQYAQAVRAALTEEFELEIRENLINRIEEQDGCAIVSIIGDGMKQKRGVAGTFFDALASQDINILAIAQGSSERSISAVTDGANGDTAVRAAHRFFFNTAQTIEVFVFGAGSIGGCLLDQIQKQRQSLADQHIDIKVMAVASSKVMTVNENGIDAGNWREELRNAVQETSVSHILGFVQRVKPLNPVFVDCTASGALPEQYAAILKAGMHIVTPNKRANSMSMDYYRSLRATANSMHRRFLYETNVGAGLPVIDTLQNLFKSGDYLTEFSGIMSGSLSYIFGRLDDGISFSQAVEEARSKKFTEPDPRDDLSGTDVARKTLIIAREAGISVEMEDIVIENVFPKDFDSSGSIEEFMQKLPQADAYFADRMAKLRKEGKTLRMAASISGGKCRVGIVEADADHPLYAVKGGENAFVFTTRRYSPIPLSVKGYGAGAEVTAAGVFGDILRTVSWNPEAK